MHYDDVLHLLLPGFICQDHLEFRDVLRSGTIRVIDRYTMEIAADFPAALVRFDVELKPFMLDYSTLYDQLTEYPSGEFRDVGPMDLAFSMPPHMAFPLLAVSLDGELYGKMWFEMPSVDDVQQQKLGGVFALDFPDGGHHTITITVDEDDRRRLDLFMLERVTVRRDDRRFADISPRSGWNPATPWLFLEGRSLDELRRIRATTHREIWGEMLDTIRCWFDNGRPTWRGVPMLTNLAFATLVDDDEEMWGRLLQIIEDRYARQVFLDYGGKFMFLEADSGLFTEAHRWVMGYGWNDYGFSFMLLEYCCLYQWLGDRLPAHLKRWIEDNLQAFGHELYRFIIFQRQYSGALPADNCHSTVPTLTVAALGATFYGQLPEATRWLNFAGQLLLEAREYFPRDGKADFLVWGPSFLAQALGMLEDITGRTLHNIPYFQNLGTALWRHHAGVGDYIASYYGTLLLAYCASVQHDAAAGWYYHHRRKEMAGASAERLVSFLHVLWHTNDPGSDPGAVKDRSWLFSDASLALLQTNYKRSRFAMRLQCGPPAGAAAYRTESFNGAMMGNVFSYGGFEVTVNGTEIIRDYTAASYIRGFANGNFVCVDGDGCFLEGMYLIGRTDKSRSAYIRRAYIAPDVCYVDGLNTLAYRAELQITQSRRQWFFDAEHEWALVLDEISSPREHDYRLHLHGHTITPIAEGVYRFTAGEETLNVVCLSNQPAAFEITPPSLILPYTYHVTKVKGASGQLSPEVAGAGFQPPVCERLVCRITEQCQSSQFLTLLSPHALEYRQEGDRLAVRTRLGERTLVLDSLGLKWEGVTANANVRFQL
ncbi:MAG: hypothetical protein ACYDBB_15650 [Armatimonadota bacterium]